MNTVFSPEFRFCFSSLDMKPLRALQAWNCLDQDKSSKVTRNGFLRSIISNRGKILVVAGVKIVYLKKKPLNRQCTDVAKMLLTGIKKMKEALIEMFDY